MDKQCYPTQINCFPGTVANHLSFYLSESETDEDAIGSPVRKRNSEKIRNAVSRLALQTQAGSYIDNKMTGKTKKTLNAFNVFRFFHLFCSNHALQAEQFVFIFAPAPQSFLHNPRKHICCGFHMSTLPIFRKKCKSGPIF